MSVQVVAFNLYKIENMPGIAGIVLTEFVLRLVFRPMQRRETFSATPLTRFSPVYVTLIAIIAFGLTVADPMEKDYAQLSGQPVAADIAPGLRTRAPAAPSPGSDR